MGFRQGLFLDTSSTFYTDHNKAQSDHPLAATRHFGVKRPHQPPTNARPSRAHTTPLTQVSMTGRADTNMKQVCLTKEAFIGWIFLKMLCQNEVNF